MIAVRNLDFRHAHDGFRLQVADLQIEEGSAVAMIGPSGSGKTTLLNLLAGVLIPDRGAVTLGETEISALADSARRVHRLRHLGMIFQEFELLAHLRVLDNILLPYRLHSALKLTAAVRAQATALAEEVGLGDKLRRRPAELSQGERQRVAVCRALVTEPPLLLCDEPTGNLDPANKEQILEILFSFRERRGATLVTVTHDHGLLGRFDRVLDFQEFLPKGGGA